jgi:hypothetical protein
MRAERSQVRSPLFLSNLRPDPYETVSNSLENRIYRTFALSRSKFTKTLLRYYSPEENPENPLQSIYHALLYWAMKRFEREETENKTDRPFASGSTGVIRRDIYKS